MDFNFKAIGEEIAKLALPMFLSYGKSESAKLLQRFHDKNPTLYAQLLIAAYPVIDVQLEDAAKQSEGAIDDQFVLTIKQIIEDSAAANGITLADLDKGTVND